MDIQPFDQRDGYIWYNGEVIPWKEAKVHVLNHGLHYASCVFEGIRVYNGKIFKLNEHSERLRASARLLDFEVPYTTEELNRYTQEIVTKQNINDGYVRPFAWRGSEQMAISARKNKIHVAIACWNWPAYYGDAKQKGLKLLLSNWARPAPNTAPCTSKAAGLYMICTMAKHSAEDAGFHDSLMLDWRGYIAEASSANIFFVMNGELHTPLPDCFLNGITRLTVIDIAKKMGIPVVERYITPQELENAQEAFVTGTAAEVTPISLIDMKDKQYPFEIGPVYKKLSEAFQALTKA